MSRFLPTMLFERFSPLTWITILLLACIAGFILLPAMVGASPGTVMPVAETQAIPTNRRVTDSPVIWLNSTDPTASLVIGGDSKGGLAVYDLAGALLRHFADYKVYSVDLRAGLKLGTRVLDLVTGSNRTDNTIALLQFDPQTPQFKNIAARKLKPDIKLYKSCMYLSSADQTVYFFGIAKNGEVEQWELFDAGSGQVDGRLVRSFDIGSQVDSCIADDARGVIYFAEKNMGIWRYPADPQDDAAPILVDKTEGNGHLQASVEALALYGSGSNEEGYLIASSDGGTEYVAYRRNRNNDYVTTFEVVAGNGVDEVSATEGLAATSTTLGSAFPQGLLLVHDEDNDEENQQNFKLISWQTIASFITPTPVSTSNPESAVSAADTGTRPTPAAPVVAQGAANQRLRGYQTTPQELIAIKQKADQGLEPYKTSVDNLFVWADRAWDYSIKAKETCKDADRPVWLDDSEGVPILYAKALAFHLTGNARYAEETKNILQRIMTEALTITLDEQQCQLNFGWGTPELVAAADLITGYWQGQTCTGPTSTRYDDVTIGSGDCKMLFQNWLVKNPYYVVSYSAANNQSNWGAAATNTTAHIADFLWDRPTVKLIHRNPRQVNAGANTELTPAEAYALANKQMIDRMNGYAVEYGSNSSCDVLGGPQQDDQWPPVKSQITENGIIPEDSRREESCNVPQYNGKYQNYPQVHLGNNIQQCELMLRRGDDSCYENIDNTDISAYSFVDPDGKLQTTHLRPGRGSIERAINAVIVDAQTEWKHESALQVAYRYYYNRHRFDGFDQWTQYLNPNANQYDQDICFGALTHGFAPGETPGLPPTVSPP